MTQVWTPIFMPWRPRGRRQCWEQTKHVCVGHPGFPTCPWGREGPSQWKPKREIFWRLMTENLGVSLSSAVFVWGFLLLFLLLLVFVCFVFSPPPLSVPPCFLTSRFPLAWATLASCVKWGTSLPQGGPDRGQEGSRSGDAILGQRRSNCGATARALFASALYPGP